MHTKLQNLIFIITLIENFINFHIFNIFYYNCYLLKNQLNIFLYQHLIKKTQKRKRQGFTTSVQCKK